jgi:hypothetical protein
LEGLGKTLSPFYFPHKEKLTMIKTLILGHWFIHQDGDRTLMAIRCHLCKNLMRTQPGKTVVCGRDGNPYTAPDSFAGLKPLITQKDLSEKRKQRLVSKSFRNWQKEQSFDLTERKWRERMKEESKRTPQ